MRLRFLPYISCLRPLFEVVEPATAHAISLVFGTQAEACAHLRGLSCQGDCSSLGLPQAKSGFLQIAEGSWRWCLSQIPCV